MNGDMIARGHTENLPGYNSGSGLLPNGRAGCEVRIRSLW